MGNRVGKCNSGTGSQASDYAAGQGSILFEKGRIIPTTKGFCVERMHSPLTELNQCAFPCASYLMFEPSRQQGCTTLGAFILRIKPHSSTPFFVSVWYKGQVVQFEQKNRNINKSRDIGKKSNCFAYRIRFLLLLKVFFGPRPVKCPICRGSRIIRRLGLGFCYIKAPFSQKLRFP